MHCFSQNLNFGIGFGYRNNVTHYYNILYTELTKTPTEIL